MPVLCSKIHSPEQLFLYTTLGMVSIAQHLKRDSILCACMKSDKAYTYILCDYVLGVILHSGEKQTVYQKHIMQYDRLFLLKSLVMCKK